MNHLKEYWEDEERLIREAVRNQKVKLSQHVDQRMDEREITEIDLMIVLLTGRIVEGYDSGTYPNYRNPDPLRIFVGENNGKKIAVGIAIQNDAYTITTAFCIGENSRLNRFFNGGQ